MTKMKFLVLMTVVAGSACGGDAKQDGANQASGDPQTPVISSASALQAWIAEGHYNDWACEPSVHDARSPSPHGKNRICSNTLASGHGDGEYPIGAANVKELYNAAGTTITGYAVMLKVANGGGDAWHWYEAVGSSVVANGLGSSGAPRNVCVGCHAGAGSDAEHSGHDQVYTQVR